MNYYLSKKKKQRNQFPNELTLRLDALICTGTFYNRTVVIETSHLKSIGGDKLPFVPKLKLLKNGEFNYLTIILSLPLTYKPKLPLNK